MSEQLKPGLYKATVRGVADTLVFVDSAGFGRTADYVGDNWREHRVDTDITSARPLIVLDLGYFSAVSFVRALRKDGYFGLAEQVEAQTKPARIPEPGWDGKVSAHTANNSKRREFVRFNRLDNLYTWADGDNYVGSVPWAALIDPALIREGVN